MDAFEANNHSFIVKIWLEESADEDGKAVWQGHITHVFTGERRYFMNLDEISAFITPYLTRMGVKLGDTWNWKLTRWRHRLQSWWRKL
jgi:hypothetical protein